MPHRRPPMWTIPWLIHCSHMFYHLQLTHYQQQKRGFAWRLTADIWVKLRGIPIITLFRQAREANIARAFEQRTIVPLGASRSK